MATALLEPLPRFLTETREGRPGGRKLTLEQRLQGAWEGLRADGAADCPVCHAPLVARDGGGACDSCGSRLS
jgi:hypothetical protein